MAESNIFSLLIVRHGPAGGPAAKARWSGRDGLRPLTPAGREKMRKAAKGIARVAGRPEAIASSPLVRARQTADLLADRVGAPVVETGALSPSAEPAEALGWLKGRSERRVALVGHEPHLGRLIAFLCGAPEPVTELKKGQACLIELSRPEPGAGKLVWSLTPSQLRKLG